MERPEHAPDTFRVIIMKAFQEAQFKDLLLAKIIWFTRLFMATEWSYSSELKKTLFTVRYIFYHILKQTPNFKLFFIFLIEI